MDLLKSWQQSTKRGVVRFHFFFSGLCRSDGSIDSNIETAVRSLTCVYKWTQANERASIYFSFSFLFGGV